MDSDAGQAGGQSSRDASLAWARALVVKARPRFGSPLWVALDQGSRCVVACLDGNEDLAALCARFAAHAAFRAVPGLRGW